MLTLSNCNLFTVQGNKILRFYIDAEVYKIEGT